MAEVISTLTSPSSPTLDRLNATVRSVPAPELTSALTSLDRLDNEKDSNCDLFPSRSPARAFRLVVMRALQIVTFKITVSLTLLIVR